MRVDEPPGAEQDRIDDEIAERQEQRDRFEEMGPADLIADAVVARLREELDTRPLLTPKTLAERLAVSERTARELLGQGVIPSFTVGEPGKETGRRIRPADVDAYIAARERESTAA